MSELPKGWVASSIGEACLIENGLRKPISLKERASCQGHYPYYGATGVIDYLNNYTHEGEYVLIGEDGANLLSKSKPLAFIAKGKYWVNNHAHTLRCLADSPNLYLEKYFNSLSLESWVTGSAQPKLTKKNLESIPYPLAPLNEQKRIVEKLDEVLTQVDTIKARLDGIPAILKRFRQSVLAAAVSGKLTEEWRGRNKPKNTNKEFRDSITEYRYQSWLNEKTKKYEEKGKFPKSDSWKTKYVAPIFEGEHLETLPDGWIQDVLEGLVYISARIGWKGLKASEYTEKGPLFLSVHSLNHGTYVELSEAFHISEERYLESPEIMLKNDDILLCKDGAGIGKIAIVKDLDEKASINSSLLLVRAGKFFDTKFLYYLLSGPKMQALVHERMTGSAVPHLFQRDVKEFVLDVPPLTEQKEIVRLVEQYFTFADTVEAQVKKAQTRVDNLTQSILAKAFRGELVPQDPNDEPADKLLERIAAARKEADALAKAAKKAQTAKKRTVKKESAQES
ncbi:TPA: restriction endonuclease subunit S [Photobacterium damselae]